MPPKRTRSAGRGTAVLGTGTSLNSARRGRGGGRGRGGSRRSGSARNDASDAGSAGGGAASSSPTSASPTAAERKAAAAAAAAEATQRAKPFRSFSGCGAVTCLAVNQLSGDLLCVGTAHGDVAVVASDVADRELAEDAGGGVEPIPASNTLRNAHRRKVTAMSCDARGRFVTGSGDGSIKLWTVDPTVQLFPVCVGTLFPAEYAAELEQPFVAACREKRFQVPEVCCVATVQNNATTFIFGGYSDGALRKWNADTEECVQILRPALGRVTCLASTSGVLLSANDTGVVCAFVGGDTRSNEAIQATWPEPLTCVTTCPMFVPPTSLRNPVPPPALIAFAGGASGTIYGLDLATGAKKCALKHFGNSGTGEGDSAAVALIAGPNCLLSAHDNGAILLWNALDWTVTGTFWHHQSGAGGGAAAAAAGLGSAVLSSAVMFNLPLLAAAGDDTQEGGDGAAAAGSNPSSGRVLFPSPGGRAGGGGGARSPSPSAAAAAAVAAAAEEANAPVRVAMITATLSGSVHVWTQCVSDAIVKLKKAEREIADGVIQKLREKLAEAKANKRRL